MIKDNLLRVRKEIPGDVKLVVVSKFRSVENIMEAYAAGQRIFGENRPQEMAAKYGELPDDIEWHMIGHLQTNKVRLIVPFVSMIQSVDSLRLAQAISSEATRIGRVTDVLLEVHIAAEESKFGWLTRELEEALKAGDFDSLSGIRIRGLMGMATFTGDAGQISREFGGLHEFYLRVNELYLPGMDTLSMGMSDDYAIAIENGSSMVRIGSEIFGPRADGDLGQ